MRILWIKTELLHPIDKGGKIRTYHMLRELKREHHITYLTLDDGSGAANANESAAEYCHELVTVPHKTHPKFSKGFYVELARNIAAPLPYFLQKYVSQAMREQITRQARDKDFDFVICDFLVSSVNLPTQLECPAILFQHNVEAVIWQRYYQVQRSMLKRAYLYNQWRKTVAYEGKTCRRFDYVITVSPEDSEIIRREYDVIKVAEIPTGVDTSYFRPGNPGDVSTNNLVFTGSMDWLPNEDAICYFTDQILPIIRKSIPDVTLSVVGRKPYQRLIDLGRRDPAITVTGRVEDVRPYMERAAAYIVPIRIGGGTRLKIFEAMAMEKPIISTTIGAEGLPVRPGIDIMLADTPIAFAKAVIEVLSDKPTARTLGVQAAQSVRERFGWQQVSDSFMDICRRAAMVTPCKGAFSEFVRSPSESV